MLQRRTDLGANTAQATHLKWWWLAIGVVSVVAAAVVALIIGPTDIPRIGVLREAASRLLPGDVSSDLTDQQKNIVGQLRLPRVILGLLVGGVLAVSGGAYQGVFRNPLADPYLLGVAAGAGLGATTAIVAGWGDGRGVFDPIPVAAFVGSLASVLMTYVVGVLGDRSRSTTSLILAGVAVASFFTALQTYVQQRDQETIRRVYEWILGSLTTSGWNEVFTLLPYAVVTTGVLLAYGRTLDVLGVGDEEASLLGIRVGRVRTIIIVVASLGTAAAVSVSGLIAFVGLVVPHTIRLLFGASYRVVLPLSVLLGGAFLTLSDLLARTLLSPAELPIGVVTAFVGAPFFIIILRSAQIR